MSKLGRLLLAGAIAALALNAACSSSLPYAAPPAAQASGVQSTPAYSGITNYSVVVGTDGLGNYGFLNGTGGSSITPTTFNGTTINDFYYVQAADIVLVLQTFTSVLDGTTVTATVNGHNLGVSSPCLFNGGSFITTCEWPSATTNYFGTSGTVPATLQ